MENQSETNIKENLSLEKTWKLNFDNMRDRMNIVNNRIDKAIAELTEEKKQGSVKEELTQKISILEAKCSQDGDEIKRLKKGNILLDTIINEKKTAINSLELSIKHWQRRFEQLQIQNTDLSDKCSALQEGQSKAEREIGERQKETDALQEEVRILKMKLECNEQKKKLYPYEQENKSGITFNIGQDNFVNVVCALSQVLGTVNRELLQEKMEKEQCIRNLEAKGVEVERLARRLETVAREMEAREKEASEKAAVRADTFTEVSHEKPFNASDSGARDLSHNADNTSDYTQSSTETSKIVFDLQKIIHYKNSTINTLQSDVIHKESLIAELENRLLNMTKEQQASKRNFHQLSDVKKSPSLGW